MPKIDFHRTDCRECHNPHELRLVRRHLDRTFRCEKCGYPHLVEMTTNGFFHLHKRNERNKIYLRKKEMWDNEAYLNELIRKKIKRFSGKYNKDLLNKFYKEGKWLWVLKARKMFIEEANMLGISAWNIYKFFRNNGGVIDLRTIQSYINQTTT